MNNLMIFNNEEFGEIRTIEVDGKPYFVGIDIAKALGYSNPSKAVIQHCKGITKLGIPSNGGIQETNCVTEGDLYRLITHSELPSAEKFESWAFDEVLPAIRKHGAYIKDELLDNPDLLLDVVTKYREERRKTEELARKNTELGNENKLLAQNVLQWADRDLINALVRAFGYGIGGDYQTAWREFKKELLYRHGININSRITHQHNNTGKRPKTLDTIADSELQQAVSTATALCRENNIDISEIIRRKAS